MLLPGLLGARLTGARLVYDSHELATGVPYRDGAWARFVAGDRAPRRPSGRRGDHGQRRDRRPPAGALRPAAPPGRRAQRDARSRRARPTGELRRAPRPRQRPLVLHQGAPAPAARLRGAGRRDGRAAGRPARLPRRRAGRATATQLRRWRPPAGRRPRPLRSPRCRSSACSRHTAEADVGVSLLQDTCENHRLALPNKVFEYLAAGVPLVVSDLPELRRLVASPRRRLGVPRRPIRGVAAACARRWPLAATPRCASGSSRAAEALSWDVERGRLVGAYAYLGR